MSQGIVKVTPKPLQVVPTPLQVNEETIKVSKNKQSIKTQIKIVTDISK